MDRRKIFVGSSTEAQELAESVGRVIERAGMEPVLWKDIFPAGDIILERIERLPGMVDGAVLVATPDLVCRRNGKEFAAAVPNVVFEYGYLSGRLSRNRVAVCTLSGVEMPSDLQGLTVVYREGDGASQHLDPRAEAGLTRWLASLVPLASGIPPMRRVCGYSGEWDVQDRFSVWHGIPVEDGDLVSWEGKTILSIRDDGEHGYGSQIGRLSVKLGDYRAQWDVANEVTSARVGKDGSLSMRIEGRARSLVEHSESGTHASERVLEKLPSTRWNLLLNPVANDPKKLEGTHTYEVAGQVYSRADEFYRWVDK